MIISIADSMKKAVSRDLDFSFEAPDLELLEEGTKFIEPIWVKGTVKTKTGQIDLDVNVHITVI